MLVATELSDIGILAVRDFGAEKYARCSPVLVLTELALVGSNVQSSWSKGHINVDPETLAIRINST